MVAWRRMPVYHTWLMPISLSCFSTVGVKSFIFPHPFSCKVPKGLRV